MHDLATRSFAPMLESLSEVLAKGAEHAESSQVDLVNARLAPDMFTLSQQVQQACHYAQVAVSRLTGQREAVLEGAEASFAGLAAQIARSLDVVRSAPPAAFEGAEERDCSIEIPDDMVIQMNGVDLLCAWCLPHFYFHVVTAYDILRHHGVQIGKMDYLSQVGGFIRPKRG